MPTPTYTPLATTTLGSNAASITLSSISQSYRDLILVINGSVNTGAANIVVKFNGDSGSNYNRVTMSGTGSSFATASGANISELQVTEYGYLDTTYSTVNVTQIMDYSATDKHKAVLARANNAANGVTAVAGRWASTSAITSIVLTFQSSSLATGSTVSLYGIAS